MSDDEIDPRFPPIPLPCIRRLEKLEACVVAMQGHHEALLNEVRDWRASAERGSLQANELIEKHAAEGRALVMQEAQSQREALRAEGERVAQQFADQTATILAVSQALNTVQANLSKWAAGGALVGAVMLFIAVRALGF